MKRLVCLLFLLLLSIKSFGAEGGESGNGGDGISFLFTSTALRLHREFLMENYEMRIQTRDVVPMDLFLMAINGTKVVSTDEDVIDNQGQIQTAVYLSPNELITNFAKYSMTLEEASRIIETAELGVIILNRERIMQELSIGMNVFLGTVFHEYLRVMGIDDDNYKVSSIVYNEEFFQRLYRKSSRVTKDTLEALAGTIEIAKSKIEFVDEELARLRVMIEEDADDLEKTLNRKLAKARKLRKQMNREFNKFAEMVGSTGMVPMPFGSYRRKVSKAMGNYVSEQPVSETKREQYQVLADQARFLMVNLKISRDNYIELREKRHEIIMESL